MSTNPRIYLDFNATAPLVPAARAAMTAALDIVGNPSSIHAEGRAARDLVERARNQVAALVGRPREQLVFTSGGTEANALGVLGLAAVVEKRGGPRVVVTTAIEHPSLAGPVSTLRARGWEVRTIDARMPIQKRETTDARMIEERRPTPDDHRILVRSAASQGPEFEVMPCRAEAIAAIEGAGVLAIGYVNHEVGTVADVTSLVPAARATGALVHIDAVQAAGKIALGHLEVDAIAISGHKIGGPQGVGALAISIDESLPIFEGGHHERGRRAGTENTIGIVGFGAAAARDELADPRRIVEELAVHTLWLEMGLRAKIADVRIHEADHVRMIGTTNAGFAAARGESIVVALDLAGIAVSTGAACTSGSVQPSAVLLGLGYTPDEAREAVRFSLGRTTTREEIDRVLEVLPPIVERARRHRAS